MRNFIKRILYDAYEVTIWMNDSGGNRIGQPQTFKLSYLKKIDQNQLIGEDMDGKKISVKTLNKFDYFVKKIY